MSGYKRVNFYELCRLCASNQQKEKTHIFQEEGRKIQLQTKIQSCLSLTVCENDFLPKVVCSQCLRSLEECYVFRKECVSSESMLSSYFKNFRYTEDFKKSGKVYIKDTSTKTSSAVTQTVATEPVSSTTSFVAEAGKTGKEHHQQVPVYAVLPQAEAKNEPKVNIINQQVAYSINPLNLATFKNVMQKNVVAETLNNEIINIAQLVDFDAFVCQPKNRPKNRKENVRTQDDPNVIKIELAQGEDFDLNQLKLDKLPHIKSNPNQPNKFTYSVRIDEPPRNNQPVLMNELNPNPTGNQMNLMYPAQSVTTQILPPQPQPPIPSFQPAAEPQAPAPPKSHACDICRKTFKRREHLYQHVKLHTGFRPFTCESCGKSFMRKEHLLRHMTSHSGQKNFTCSVCDKSFSRNDNLLKHRKTHEKQSSFTCEVCQKQFVMRHYYVAHKMTHEADKCGGAAWGLLKV